MDPQEEIDYEAQATLTISIDGIKFESKISCDISINPNPKPTKTELEEIAINYFKEVHELLFTEYDCEVSVRSVRRLN